MDRFKKIMAFFAIYVIWGSTYLAIRYGIETIPPLTLSAIRYLVAGGCMAVAAFFLREKALDRGELKIGALSGMLLIIANAGVCIVEQTLPSGLCAVVIGTMPVWILILSWLFFQGGRPSLLKLVGSVVACVGIALIAVDSGTSVQAASSIGFVYLALSCLLWSFGTLVQRQLPKIKSPVWFSAWQMLSGATATLIASAIFERPWQHDWARVDETSLWALAYLIVFGSLIGFSAYNWLSRNVQPYLVSTYALVNPVIAVLLGSVFYREPITPMFLVATTIIMLGLVLLLLKSSTPKPIPVAETTEAAMQGGKT